MPYRIGKTVQYHGKKEVWWLVIPSESWRPISWRGDSGQGWSPAEKYTWWFDGQDEAEQQAQAFGQDIIDEIDELRAYIARPQIRWRKKVIARVQKTIERLYREVNSIRIYLHASSGEPGEALSWRFVDRGPRSPEMQAHFGRFS